MTDEFPLIMAALVIVVIAGLVLTLRLGLREDEESLGKDSTDTPSNKAPDDQAPKSDSERDAGPADTPGRNG